jgi:hypothetical protein
VFNVNILAAGNSDTIFNDSVPCQDSPAKRDTHLQYGNLQAYNECFQNKQCHGHPSTCHFPFQSHAQGPRKRRHLRVTSPRHILSAASDSAKLVFLRRTAFCVQLASNSINSMLAKWSLAPRGIPYTTGRSRCKAGLV